MENQKNGDFYDDGNQGYDGYVNQLAQPPDAEAAARQQEEWKQDLTKLEEEIHTLRSVLSVKVRQANELKKKLGITPLGELKADLRFGYQAIKDSEVVQKTNNKLQTWGDSISNSTAVQKTNTALQTFGSYASRKLGDIRNSNAMKSMEGKLGDAYSSVKYKMGVTTSASNISEYNGPSTSAAAGARAADDTDDPAAGKEKLPEEKVPL